MRLLVKGHGELEIEGLVSGGLPALRLVQYHSPELQVSAHNGIGFIRVRLGDVDLRPSLQVSEPVNMDRAQLAALGK